MITGGVLTMGSLTSNIINNSTTTNNSEHNFNTWVNLKFRTRIYDLVSPFTNLHKCI